MLRHGMRPKVLPSYYRPNEKVRPYTGNKKEWSKYLIYGDGK